jgi:mannose-6-phosphate isomerase
MITLLPPNQLQRNYRGGARIGALRGDPRLDAAGPEDWVGSTTTALGSEGDGLSRLRDGQLLRDAIHGDPVGFLGEAHVRRWGPNPAVLVKLLDAGERLPVHFHPGRAFAQARLGLSYGKTEAWIIIAAEPGAIVHLGFAAAVTGTTVARWVQEQDLEAMLSAMPARPVGAGDVVFVPAGTLHAIGAGILLCELQEPTDLSVFLEWDRPGTADGSEHLGLGWPTVLSALDRDATELASLTGRWDRSTTDEAVQNLLPDIAQPYFRAEGITVRGGRAKLEPGFAVLVVLDGQATARSERGQRMALTRGDTALVPHAAGAVVLEGNATIIRCRPPAPEAGDGRW